MKILIVEDEVDTRQLLQMLLSDYGTCDLAANGQEALAAVEQAIKDEEPYDLAFMDIMMPEMDGMEALQKIRRMEFKHFGEELKSMKVIMATAKDMAKDIQEAFRSGCEAYITKPFNKEKLLEQITELGLMDADDGDSNNEDDSDPDSIVTL